MTTRVNGGVITDQMMNGKIRYFIITTAGATDLLYTIAPDDTTVIVPGQEVDGSTATVYEFYVGENMPVPLSIADRILRVVTDKCTILQMNFVDADEIHLAIASEDNAWNTDSIAASDVFSDAAANMETAIQALGYQGNNPTAITSGALIIGEAYEILNYLTADDFSNVGGPGVEANGVNDGIIFTATGTTPTTWTNASELQLQAAGPAIPDNTTTGTSYIMTTVTVAEVEFNLA